MSKLLKLMWIPLLLVVLAAGCLSRDGNGKADGFDVEREITVVSREAGSGTRGAFVELFGIEQKDEQGNKVDYTTEEASITNNTSVMIATVAGNKYAIGYVSLGSLSDKVKAVAIDGSAPTTKKIKNGTYKIARPFNIATRGEVREVAQDFIDFILSAEGQKIVEDAGYIDASSDAPALPVTSYWMQSGVTILTVKLER